MSNRSDNDPVLIGLRLRTVLAALERIPRRFAAISEPGDFMTSEAGLDSLDSICMVLIAAGEEFKQIDRKTEGELFAKYPHVSWRSAIGLRDVLAHAYFQADPEQIYRTHLASFLMALAFARSRHSLAQ